MNGTVIGTRFLYALTAAALAAALFVFISTNGWDWRLFFSITAPLTVVLFVLAHDQPKIG
jgi:MFS family permease